MIKTYINESGVPARFEEASQGKSGYKILGKLHVPFFDLNAATRNGRNYSEAAEDALQDEIFREKIATRTFFGRLGHPMNDDEAAEDPAVRACVLMSSYEKNKSTNMYEGTLEILDNDYGKQLKSLIDAGCQMGVSTRGSGDSYNNDDGTETIKKGTYDFEALDVVTLPAVKSARVTVCESLDKSKRMALESLVRDSKDKHVLEQLKVTLESTAHPKKKELLEEIDKKLSNDTGTTESLASDIELLTSKLTESELRSADLQKKLDEALGKLAEHESKSSTGTTEGEKSVSESTRKLVKLLKSSAQVIESMKEDLAKKNSLIESYKGKMKKAVGVIESLKEDRHSLEQASISKQEKIDLLEKKNNSLEEQLTASKDKVTKLESEGKSKASSLTESLSKQSSQVKSLTEQLATSEEKVSRLESKNTELDKSLVATRSKLIESIAEAYGISLEELRSKVTPRTSTEQIEKAAKKIREDLDLRKEFLPELLAVGKKVSASQIPNLDDQELDRAARVARNTQ